MTLMNEYSCVSSTHEFARVHPSGEQISLLPQSDRTAVAPDGESLFRTLPILDEQLQFALEPVIRIAPEFISIYTCTRLQKLFETS